MNGKSMENASRIARRYLLLEILPAIGIMTFSKDEITEPISLTPPIDKLNYLLTNFKALASTLSPRIIP